MTNSKTDAVVIAYWDIRGYAGPIRLLLAYTNTPFVNKLYTTLDKEHGYSKKDWTDAKETLHLDFPNLPYLIDGKVKLTQSVAIMRYISRKHGLLGKTEEEMYKVDMMEGEILDFRSRFSGLCYSPEFEGKKAAFLESLPCYLERFEKFIGGHKHAVGDNFTYIDILLYEYLDQHLCLDSTCLDKFDHLKKLHKSVGEIDSIKKFRDDSRCILRPLNNVHASFK
jgi:glutathione S-transferase